MFFMTRIQQEQQAQQTYYPTHLHLEKPLGNQRSGCYKEVAVAERWQFIEVCITLSIPIKGLSKVHKHRLECTFTKF